MGIGNYFFGGGSDPGIKPVLLTESSNLRPVRSRSDAPKKPPQERGMGVRQIYRQGNKRGRKTNSTKLKNRLK